MTESASKSGAIWIAAIQATPVILDAEATVEKACGLLGGAAAAQMSAV
jgi:hypothetical protein